MRRKRFLKISQIIEKTINRREHKILTTVDQDPYPEEYGYLHKHKRGYRGYWKSKLIWQHQVRMYRTWKHNRKTQYKIKKLNEYH
jgi:hypothetical protein